MSNPLRSASPVPASPPDAPSDPVRGAPSESPGGAPGDATATEPRSAPLGDASFPAPALDLLAAHDLAALAPVPRVVTIGTFDGVHRGHRYLLDCAVRRGRELGMEAAAVTFEPLPPAVLRPDRFSGRLCTAAEKLAAIAAAGVDDIAVIPFTLDVARQSPETFMADLHAATHLRELWVGDDFALGKDRTGDLPRLTEIGRDLGFAVVALPRLAIDGQTVSSSAIRRAVEAGEAGTARHLLGRPFRVGGEVIHGKGLGRTIGFPTANVVPPPDLIRPADGIYAAWAWLPADAAPRPAIAYVGTRPAVGAGARLIETHLLDFDGDLYGQQLRTDFLERLRPDATFDSLDALVAQMTIDKVDARRVLAALAASEGFFDRMA